jgi:hypothetical protein
MKRFNLKFFVVFFININDELKCMLDCLEPFDPLPPQRSKQSFLGFTYLLTICLKNAN